VDSITGKSESEPIKMATNGMATPINKKEGKLP